MPNYCHNHLSIEGPIDAIKTFMSKVAVTEGERQTPLTFNGHVPEPSEAEYAALEETQKIVCTMCGGRGIRPVNAEEAKAYGAKRWEDSWADMDWLKAEAAKPVDDRAKCNVCGGEGRELPFFGGWYGWRTANWGTKWDAVFGDYGVALSNVEGADPQATVDLQGRMFVPSGERATVIYDFDTAWGPPSTWLERTAELEPELTFVMSYGEAGMDFGGEITIGKDVFEEKEGGASDFLAQEEMWY